MKEEEVYRGGKAGGLKNERWRREKIGKRRKGMKEGDDIRVEVTCEGE